MTPQTVANDSWWSRPSGTPTDRATASTCEEKASGPQTYTSDSGEVGCEAGQLGPVHRVLRAGALEVPQPPAALADQRLELAAQRRGVDLGDPEEQGHVDSRGQVSQQRTYGHDPDATRDRDDAVAGAAVTR